MKCTHAQDWPSEGRVMMSKFKCLSEPGPRLQLLSASDDSSISESLGASSLDFQYYPASDPLEISSSSHVSECSTRTLTSDIGLTSAITSHSRDFSIISPQLTYQDQSQIAPHNAGRSEGVASSLANPVQNSSSRFHHVTDLNKFARELEEAAKAAFPDNSASRYTSVHVLMITWETESRSEVLMDMEELQRVLSVEYGFDVSTFLIPSERPHLSLNKKVTNFVEAADDSSDILKIVYYSGHGEVSEHRQTIWTRYLPSLSVKNTGCG